MNSLMKLLGVVLGMFALSVGAQTTNRTLFTGGATINTNYGIKYNFNDSTCREVIHHNSYPAGTLNWFQSSIYCSGFKDPIVTSVYSRYDYPSPSPIKSCASSKTTDPDVVFFYFSNCSFYVGAKVSIPITPITKSLYTWVWPVSYYDMPVYTMHDASCYFTTETTGSGYTERFTSYVYCAGVDGPVTHMTRSTQGWGGVRKNGSSKVITDVTANTDTVLLQIN